MLIYYVTAALALVVIGLAVAVALLLAPDPDEKRRSDIIRERTFDLVRYSHMTPDAAEKQARAEYERAQQSPLAKFAKKTPSRLTRPGDE